MAESNIKREMKFFDYINILYKWRNFLIITLIIFSLLTLGILFLLPNQYKSTTVIMLPPETNLGLGGLTGLLSGKTSTSSLGSKLLGMTSGNQDVLLAILNSRTSLTKTIDRFNLFNYYDIDEKNYDKVLKAFVEDISFEPTEYGMIEISVINKYPRLAAQMANYFAELVDSLNIEFNTKAATNNRIFIEKRYLKNLEDLKAAEDSLYKLQKKFGVFAIPQQLEVAVKSAAEVEAQLIERELYAEIIKNQVGENTPAYKQAIDQVNFLRKKVLDIKNSPKLSGDSNVLLPFKNLPELSIQYLRHYRELEIQQKILEVILPLYEQAKVEEQKSIPTILILDKAVPAQLKYSPKRATITIIITLIMLFILIPVIFHAERVLNKDDKNELERIESKLFSKIKTLFKI
ncbi:MAG: Wzz/FepE/Etk N-terminal domain-containing protein [Ignavibacterium album]|jgi:capsule polysaccharide export protein KpsE/RkpR|uniref:Wzz/FepE/Etk N-terminal domain-containing protein n=1 Tax=Ignavibacterium album TaxID=591197 RepID=UPI0026F136AA|nr:Wzz/FepE/Etk N-terminal domain-containing protein [Ignavibacterium album]MCX8105111.1 Wzz/FepE/Etk N-terminal domain-containing protein [Ignavibacterium album]